MRGGMANHIRKHMKNAKVANLGRRQEGVSELRSWTRRRCWPNQHRQCKEGMGGA